MDCVTSEIAGYLNNSSMIRKMFEAGLELKNSTARIMFMTSV